ncbi:MAG: hypothetical protein ACOXZ4_07250 [Sphaerochaetaceae bacterium]
MQRGRRLGKLITILVLLAALGVSTLGARVVASQTIVFHGFIAQHVEVAVGQRGEILLTSNNPYTQLSYHTDQQMTYLSIAAL